MFIDIAIQFDLRQTYKGGRISGEGKQCDWRYRGFRNWSEASCQERERYIGEMHTTTEKQKSLFDRNIHDRVLSLVVCVSYFSMEVMASKYCALVMQPMSTWPESAKEATSCRRYREDSQRAVPGLTTHAICSQPTWCASPMQSRGKCPGLGSTSSHPPKTCRL